MKKSKYLVVAAVGLSVAAGAYSTDAATNSSTLRTAAAFIGVAQGTTQVTGTPELDLFTFPGRDLVNLAMGRVMDNKTVTNEVLALVLSCDLSNASLVVYDRSSSNVVKTIAAASVVDSAKQQDRRHTAPNRARFVAQFQVGASGSATDGLLGGYLTVAGHVQLDETTGCPVPVLVGQDHDAFDHLVGDKEIPTRADPDSDRLVQRTGLAHAIGVLHTVTGGATNTILVPHGNLSIRRLLPVAPSMPAVVTP